MQGNRYFLHKSFKKLYLKNVRVDNDLPKYTHQHCELEGGCIYLNNVHSYCTS